MNIKHRIVWLATTIAGAATVPAQAQTAPVAPAPEPATAPTAPSRAVEADSGEVLVIAERGPTVAIDRKSYLVRQGPAAETGE